MARAGQRSACPQCGAPLMFGGAHSIVVVCEHCRSAIARVGVNVESLGRMPDLVATDTRLALGASGKLAKLSFTVVGRIQLHQGRAGWDEWYVLWSDGSFGWLAEAQGRVILTHRYEQPVQVPAFASARAGQSIELPGVGRVSVQETGEARVLSAQGELPFQPQFGRSYRFVDASLSNGGYVTLDYGIAGDDAEVFLGRELSYAETGITQLAPERGFGAPQVRGEALSCPNCGAPLSLKAKETKSIVCDSCRGLCGLSGGKLALIAALQQRESAALPLGARGKLFAHELEVIGWVRRGCTVDGVDYTWNEYLLHGDVGYRWLTESKGHWTYLKSIPAASVDASDPGTSASLAGEDFKHFQTSEDVRYENMQGEFYWLLDPSDRAQMIDYVDPPNMLSCETTSGEVQWTHGSYVDAREVWVGFNQPGAPPGQSGVAPCQPNPHAPQLRNLWLAFGLAFSLLVFMTIGIRMELPRRTALVFDVPLSGEQSVSISPTFQLESGTHAAEIAAVALGMLRGQSSWLGLDIALINDETGDADALALELSHYEGYEDGSPWSEDNSSSAQIVGSVAPGRYVLRVEPHVEPGSRLPDTVQVRLTHGVMQWPLIVVAVLLLISYPLVLSVRSGIFESRRWSESDHASSGSDDSSSSDDD